MSDTLERLEKMLAQPDIDKAELGDLLTPNAVRELLTELRLISHPPLFEQKTFTAHSGGLLHWKIECDALTDDDWVGLARIAAERLPAFQSVYGVPRGGLAFAAALEPYATGNLADPFLIADDVLTTGRSMTELRDEVVPGFESADAIGVVAFARCSRSEVPDWIIPIWQLWYS